jgi:hypothetical protein
MGLTEEKDRYEQGGTVECALNVPLANDTVGLDKGGDFLQIVAPKWRLETLSNFTMNILAKGFGLVVAQSGLLHNHIKEYWWVK